MTINQKVTSIIEAYTKHLQDWFNAEIKMEDIEKFSQMIHDDWKIINKNVPGFEGNKEDFLTHWKTLYGKHKHDRIKYFFSDLKVEKLSDLFYLTTFVENYKFSTKNNKWPMTIILKYDKNTNSMLIYYTHE